MIIDGMICSAAAGTAPCGGAMPDSVASGGGTASADTAWRRADFHGVLRPEFNDNISFDALKQEYAVSRVSERGENKAKDEAGQNSSEEAEPDEDDWEDEM